MSYLHIRLDTLQTEKKLLIFAFGFVQSACNISVHVIVLVSWPCEAIKESCRKQGKDRNSWQIEVNTVLHCDIYNTDSGGGGIFGDFPPFIRLAGCYRDTMVESNPCNQPSLWENWPLTILLRQCL